MASEKRYTPALGVKWLTPLYDIAVALLTRENHWRRELVTQIASMPNDRIVDIGCGTGSLAILLKAQNPDANIAGIDPDPAVLARAKKKSAKQGVEIDWHQGFLSEEVVKTLRTATKVVSSLVFHQTPLDEKQNILNNAYKFLGPGGELHIADYGLQRTRIMRFLFRQTVQRVDGVSDTQPNADGMLPDLIEKAGFIDVAEVAVVPTVTGSISLYRARRG